MSKEKLVITFKKENQNYNIIEYESILDLSKIKDMKEFVYEKENILESIFKEDVTYKIFGSVEKKGKKFLIQWNAFQTIY